MRAAIAAAMILLAGCVGLPFAAADVAVGTPKQEVLARLGAPTRSVPMPGGERLQYSQQPHGYLAWMVDLDAAGRLVNVRQVLQPAEFDRVVPGQWTRQDVEREFGPPAIVERLGNWDGPVLDYRWRDATQTPQLYVIYVDRQGMVRRTHYAPDFEKMIDGPNDRN